MSLYGNFTLKEWLALHCATKDIDDIFRKALEKNDEPMAVLALAELVKRGDSKLAACAVGDAVDAGHISLGSHFSIVFANALIRVGGRDVALKKAAKAVCGEAPRSESFEEVSIAFQYLSGSDQIKEAADSIGDSLEIQQHYSNE